MAVTIPRTAWIDDDGSGTTGTVLNNAVKTELYEQIDFALAGVQAASGIVQTITSTGLVTISLTAGVSLVRCSNASLLTVQGLSAGTDGQEVTLEAYGAGQINFLHQAAGAVAGTKLVLPITSAPVSLTPTTGTGRAVFIYDAGPAVWRMKLHAQGGLITPVFNGAAFLGVGGTWTVDAGDVLTCQYSLDAMRGLLSIFFNLQTTTIGAGVSYVNITNAMWGGFSVPTYFPTTVIVQDAGASGLAFAQPIGTNISIQRTSGAWVTTANATNILGQVICGVS